MREKVRKRFCNIIIRGRRFSNTILPPMGNSLSGQRWKRVEEKRWEVTDLLVWANGETERNPNACGEGQQSAGQIGSLLIAHKYPSLICTALVGVKNPASRPSLRLGLERR